MLVGTLFVAVILDYVFIDEFGVVDEEAGHFFFEEFDAANIGIIFVKCYVIHLITILDDQPYHD